MKFATLALIGLVAAVKIQHRAPETDVASETEEERERRDRDEWTGRSLVNHCDKNDDEMLNLKEAKDCVKEYFNKEGMDAAQKLEDHWEFIAGDDKKATVEELDAALAAHEEHREERQEEA